jgi:hypothetical protein
MGNQRPSAATDDGAWGNPVTEIVGFAALRLAPSALNSLHIPAQSRFATADLHRTVPSTKVVAGDWVAHGEAA